MAITTLSAKVSVNANWSAQKPQTGTNYQPLSNPGNLSKTFTNGTTVANASAGGSDEIVSFLQTIAASGSATLDLTSLTDVLQIAGVSFARLKAIMIRLLTATDDATNGTACSGILVGAATATPANLNMGGGSGCTVDVTAAAGAITAVVLNAAGSGYPPSTTVALLVAGGTGGVIAARTNSSGVVTAVVFITGSGGSGYSTGSAAATVPVAYQTISKGGAKVYADNTAAGIVVDSTHKSLKLVNLDAAVAACVEVTFIGGSS